MLVFNYVLTSMLTKMFIKIKIDIVYNKDINCIKITIILLNY